MKLYTIIALIVILLTSCSNHSQSKNSTDDNISSNEKVSIYVPPLGTDTLPCGLRESLDFNEDWNFDIKDCYGPMELTDSLQNRIRLFVENEPNFIIYQLQKFPCFKNDEPIFEAQKALENEYIFRSDDKEALYEFLCQNTALYNLIGSRYRMTAVVGHKWPF